MALHDTVKRAIRNSMSNHEAGDALIDAIDDSTSLHGITPGTAEASKALILDASKGIATLTSMGVTTLTADTISGASDIVRNVGTVVTRQGAPSNKTATSTITAAELLSRIVTKTGTPGFTQALTLPTGTLLDAALPATFVKDDAFEYAIINLSAAETDTVTMTAGADHSIVGVALVESSHEDAETISSAIFRCRKTTTNTFISYRIG